MVNQFISRILVFISHSMAIAIGTVIISGKFVTADTSSTDYIFLLDRDRQSCQQIGEGYRDVRAFETDNFYINICQQEDSYYYVGEAKTGKIGTIFLPANVLASGEMYRANNGNVAYIVTILPRKAILTIERNGAQIAIENSHQKQCLDSYNISSISILDQLYYPMSDTRILGDEDRIQLAQSETIDLHKFYDFNSVAEYNPQGVNEICAR